MNKKAEGCWWGGLFSVCANTFTHSVQLPVWKSVEGGRQLVLAGMWDLTAAVVIAWAWNCSWDLIAIQLLYIRNRHMRNPPLSSS
jgi:hypothetical protein